MKKVSKLSVLAVFSILGFSTLISSCAKKISDEEVKIYAVIHDEEAKALTELFTKKTGIKATYLRATTGELVNRVINEKDAPQADILLGGATAYHIQADKEGALEKYVSPVLKNYPDFAKSPEGTYTGFCLLTLGIGISKNRFDSKYGAKNIDYPKTWDDLLNPEFKGEIVLTNPLASSTAYLFVQDQLQRSPSQEAGWDYLTKLSQNVGQFPDSGSAPPKLVGTGEYSLGVAYIHALSKYKSQGFDIKIVAPPQSVGDTDCVAILKNTKNLSAAKKFVDFILSAEAQELMSSLDFTTPCNPDAKPNADSVSVKEINLINYDSEKAASEKKAVLEKWSKIVK